MKYAKEKELREKLQNIIKDKQYVDLYFRTAYRPEELDYILDFLNHHPDADEVNLLVYEMNWLNGFLVHRAVSAIVGLVVGDALGVPVEFSDRESRSADPVTDMRGYGTHNQPPGTWSDDSSMTIATLEWLKEFRDDNKFIDDMNYGKLMDKFYSWMMNGKYTPYGRKFDIGIATSSALIKFGRGEEPLKCGGTGERDNGNGSLMRILPASLFFHVDFEVRINKPYVPYIYNISALTHGHARSKLGCLIYTTIVSTILRFSYLNKKEIFEKAMESVSDYLSTDEDDPAILSEREAYSRLYDTNSFIYLPEEEIRSSGYVVDTLEAAIWCYLNTDSYKDCVLKAVNLGDDTDTVGAVAGGLAGLFYGIENIPADWVNIIPKVEDIMTLAKNVVKAKTDHTYELTIGAKRYII